jgi:hypothetical protein
VLNGFPQILDVSIREAFLMGGKIPKRRKAKPELELGAASSRRGSPPYISSMKLTHPYPVFHTTYPSLLRDRFPPSRPMVGDFPQQAAGGGQYH